MDDQRLGTLAAGADMGAKTRPLPFQIALQPVIVESGLADRNHLGMGGQGEQTVQARLLAVLGVGMDTGCGKQIGMGLGQRDDRRQTLQGDPGDQRPAHPVVLHRGEHRGGVGRQIGKVDMTMGIDEECSVSHKLLRAAGVAMARA